VNVTDCILRFAKVSAAGAGGGGCFSELGPHSRVGYCWSLRNSRPAPSSMSAPGCWLGALPIVGERTGRHLENFWRTARVLCRWPQLQAWRRMTVTGRVPPDTSPVVSAALCADMPVNLLGTAHRRAAFFERPTLALAAINSAIGPALGLVVRDCRGDQAQFGHLCWPLSCDFALPSKRLRRGRVFPLWECGFPWISPLLSPT
jgi:hypothetical protein